MRSLERIGRLVATLIFGISFWHAAAASAADTTWGCYDPQPGHPTAAERAAFVERMKPVATQVAVDLGVPRIAILGMAIQESGYGWTRTALNARNLFGWKYGSSAQAANLASWRLDCQPESDPGKDYAVFASFEDSMRFVATQLSTSQRYRATTEAAKAAAQAHAAERATALEWLRGIQRAGYNPNPRYPDDVMRAAQGGGIADGWAVQQPAASDPAAPDPEDVALALGKLRARGSYMISDACKPEAQSAWQGYESLPDGVLQRCPYSVTPCGAGLDASQRQRCEARRTATAPLSATVVVLEPGLERFARWIASACKTVGGNRAKCIDRLFKAGNGQSGWQIVAAGIVFEDLETNDFAQFGYAFRDGMTAKADAECGWTNGASSRTAPQAAPTPAQDAACSAPNKDPQRISKLARPLGTTRSELVDWDPSLATALPPLPNSSALVDGDSAQAWRLYVRKTLVEAATADSNPLVTAKAFALQKRNPL